LAAVARFVPVAGGNHHLKNVDRSGVITEIINWLESNGG